MTVNWGIIGGARIVHQVILAIQKTTNGQVLAIASRDLNIAKKFANLYKIPFFYGDYTHLLEDQRLDAIYIPLPNHLHKKWVIKSAKHKKHVLCEKPFALNTEEGKEMFTVCNNEEVVAMEGMMYRFNPIISKIEALIAENIIGELRFINFNFSHDINTYLKGEQNYRYDKEKGGGALFDLGVYGINFCNYLLKSVPTRIIQSSLFNNRLNGVDTIFNSLLQYKNITCNITSSFDFYGNYVIFSGTRGVIEISRLTSSFQKSILIKNTRNEIISTIISEKFDNFKSQFQHFNMCVLENLTPLISQKETLDTLSTIDKIFEKANKYNN